MLSRVLISAAMGLVLAQTLTWSTPASAQNLEAGKSPGQIFSNTCAVCHRSARGLLKTVSPGALPGFLRQHYTTSSNMAASLSAYLTAGGAAAADPRAKDNLTPRGREARQGGGVVDPAATAPDPRRPARDVPPGAEQAARPDADGLQPTSRQGRRAARPDAATPDAQVPAERAKERGPDGRRQQRLTKRGKPDEKPKDAPAAETSRKDDTAARPDAAQPRDNTPQSSEISGDKPAPADRPSDAAKLNGTGDMPASSTPTRPDPVPQVTPAPRGTDETSPAASERASPEPGSGPSAQAPAATGSAGSDASRSDNRPKSAGEAAPRAPDPATGSTASPPPAAPGGPPQPPISQ